MCVLNLLIITPITMLYCSQNAILPSFRDMAPCKPILAKETDSHKNTICKIKEEMRLFIDPN